MLNRITILAVAALVVAVWLGRYSIERTSNAESSTAYRLDRWTGEVLWLRNDESVRVEPAQDEPAR